MSSKPYLNPVLWTAAVIGSWGFLGNLILVPALPSMIAPLHATPETIGLVLSAFTLPGVFLTPFIGHLMDRVGYHRILMLSLVFYGITGLLGGLATDFLSLLMLRFLQGISTVALLPLAMIIVGTEYTTADRSEALGILNAIYNVFAAVFPLIGGLLAEVSWQTPFIVYVLAFPTALISYYVITRPQSRGQPNDDQPFRATKPETGNAPSLSTIFSHPSFLKPSLLGFLSFFLLIGIGNSYLPIYLTDFLRFSPSYIGVLTASRISLTAIISVMTGRLSSRYSPDLLYLASYFFSLVSFSGITLLFGSPLSLLPILFLGMGHGLVIPLSHTLIYEQTSPKRKGLIVSTYQTILRLGQTTGPAVFGLIYGIGQLPLVLSAGVLLNLLIAVALLSLTAAKSQTMKHH
ncbi:MAG: MFS transporter [Candidatus Ranarchaeia archaeon]